MKDSHNDELLDELRRRLGGYEEAPDGELWDRIHAAVHPSPGYSWVRATMRTGTVAALLFLSLSIFLDVDDDGIVNPSRDFQSATAASLSPDTVESGLLSPVLTESPTVITTQDMQPVAHVPTPPSPLFANPGSADSVQSTENANQFHEPRGALRVNASDSLQSLIPGDLKTDSAVVADRKDTPALPRLKKPIILYAGLSGSLAFQKVTPFGDDGIAIQSLHARPVFSQERFGLSFHAGIQSKVARRLELYSGVSLYTQSLRLIYEHDSDEMAVDQDNALEYSIVPGTKRAVVDYSMLNAGVEAGLIYYLTGDRLQHKFGSGLLWHRGFKSASGDNTYDNAGSHYLLYQLFYRNELIVNSNTNLFVQPFYRHALVSRESLSAPFKVKSYYAGLTFGIVYRPR